MNITNIKADINFLCYSTSATYPDADKIRNINNAYSDVTRLIWSSTDGWQYDDSNATTLPKGIATLVHNQQDYSLPSTAQRVRRIEIKDKGGDWQLLKPIDLADVTVASPEFYSSPGMPIYYDMLGRSIMFYPTPHSASVTLASGLAVYMDRDVTEFPVTASTATPGFATPFHRILSYAASLDFIQDERQRKMLLLQKDRLEKGLVSFYSKRNVELPTRIKPASEKRWRQYQ